MVEFVGIELDLRGADKVYDDLERIDGIIRSLGGRKKVDAGLSEARKQVIAYRGELEKLQREQRAYAKGSDTWNTIQKEIDETKDKLKDAQQAVREFGYATKAAGRTFAQTFNSISSKVAHIGSSMQSLGNALVRLTSPFERLTTGIVMGAGYKMLNAFTEGLSNGFDRYDTMKKFPKIMSAFGYSAEESTKAVNALDQSVRGLPTGLNEMVDLTQRFTATTGDLEKGTKLAIATNNAFLASMSTDTQRYQGMMQLQDVLGGKDMNSREWNSLVSSMTPAIVKMGESLGYTSKNMSEWIQKVRDGKVANEDFIDTLIKVGTEGGEVAKMAQNSKDTWQAFFANVGNAASRMTAGIINALDEITQTVAGKDLNMFLAENVNTRIDKMTESVKAWIKAHPEEIKEFFSDLAKIDWKSLGKGFIEGLGSVVKMIQILAKFGQGKDLSWIGKFGVWLNMAGKGLLVFGGVIKGLRHPIAGIATILTKLLGGKFGGSLFGKLKGLFGSKGEAQEMGSFADIAKGSIKKLQGLAEAAGAVLIVSGTGFVAFKAVKSMIKDLGEIITIADGIDWNRGRISLVAMVGAIGFATEAFNAVGTMLGKQGLLSVAIAGLASVIVTGSFAADLWLIKKGFQNFKETLETVNDVVNEINNFQSIGNLESVKVKAQSMVDALNEITNIFKGKSGSIADRGEVKAGLPTFSSFKVQDMTNLSNAITQIQKIVGQLNALGGMTITNDPSKVLADIKNACNQLQGIRAPKNILSHTQEAANALIQIRRMAYHINKLAGTSVDTGGFASFVQQIKTALNELKSLSQVMELDIKVVLGSGFKSSVDGVVKQIKDAKKRIEKLKTPIRFSIPVYVKFSVSTNIASAIAKIRESRQALRDASGNVASGNGGGRAMGGMIYRAGGGGVPKRRGTDTVPAMLTPGEYVQNKRAVSMFGIDFMRKVNNLDVKGAMNELMSRAGHMAGAGRSSVVNNYYNNNQRVDMHISNPSPSFAVKTASRFVGAF